MKNQPLASLEISGSIHTVIARNGGLVLCVEGIELGAVRGTKRLAGPQIANSSAANKAAYAELSRQVCLSRLAA